MNTFDTIVATATPTGRGGIAVIRISGNKVRHIAECLLRKIPKPRFALYTPFLNKAGQILDEGIALFFEAPYSFTGEDVLELHGHGGMFIVEQLIKEIISYGARLARPGEFSERAFLNDKLDLIQAEAISDLIDAASQDAAIAAMRSLRGEFSQKIQDLVDGLIHLRTYVEASIDFVEEEIDFLNDGNIGLRLKDLIDRLENIEMSAIQGSLLRNGITAIIIGEPNVGKSSLLNVLCGYDAAIVTHIAGTTRDLLRETIIIDGMPMHIIDTAGLRESEDIVEREGIRRAHQEIEKADLILCMIEAKDPLSKMDVFLKTFSHKKNILMIRNKIDLTQETPNIQSYQSHVIVSLSAKKNEGMDLLKKIIKENVGLKITMEGTFSARRRHLDALACAKQFLLEGLTQLQENRAGELLAEDLRQAQYALNEITGVFTTDDLLGKIFSSFCIGK